MTTKETIKKLNRDKIRAIINEYKNRKRDEVIDRIIEIYLIAVVLFIVYQLVRWYLS